MAARRSLRPAQVPAVSLQDVAERAGVSTATVSRVINGAAPVSEDQQPCRRSSGEHVPAEPHPGDEEGDAAGHR